MSDPKQRSFLQQWFLDHCGARGAHNARLLRFWFVMEELKSCRRASSIRHQRIAGISSKYSDIVKAAVTDLCSSCSSTQSKTGVVREEVLLAAHGRVENKHSFASYNTEHQIKKRSMEGIYTFSNITINFLNIL